MLDRVAVHQTRLRTPGLGLDAKGVALGAKGLVLLPSIDRLVAFLALYTRQNSLADILRANLPSERSVHAAVLPDKSLAGSLIAAGHTLARRSSGNTRVTVSGHPTRQALTRSYELPTWPSHDRVSGSTSPAAGSVVGGNASRLGHHLASSALCRQIC